MNETFRKVKLTRKKIKFPSQLMEVPFQLTDE